MQFAFWRILRYVIIILCLISLFLASIFYYVCSSEVCNLQKFHSLIIANYSFPFRKRLISSQHREKSTDQDFSKNASINLPNKAVSYDKLSVGLSSFSIRLNDVIVFLHLQNTGGSVFTRHMIEDLVLERPCKCRTNRRICQCYRPNKYGSPWLFSRYTTGWKCGVHPDWLELSNCVDRAMDEEEGKPVKRRYFFISMLRDPIKRFLSEFWHTRRGQNWLSSRHLCNDNEGGATSAPCFSDINIHEVSIEEFISCPQNLAINRQTRMLSDFSLVGCYNSSSLPNDDRDLLMLASAKTNLHKLAFFGLSEYPKVSQYVFEATFGMTFKTRDEAPRQHLLRSARKQLFKEITPKALEKIKQMNHLDIELYHYAKELLFYRFEKLKKIDPAFQDNFNVIKDDKQLSEDWAEKEDFMSFLANDSD